MVHRAIPLSCALAALLMWLPPAGDAHHSRTNFVMDSPVELEGTITEHAYHNPHVYLMFEATDAATGETVEWQLEANAVSTVRSVGWMADTFSAGDRVSVRGFPHRQPDRHTLFVDVITRADGSAYRSSGLPPGSFQAAETAPGAAAAGDATVGSGTVGSTTAGSTDFSGVWQPDFASRNVAGGFRQANLPLTPAGQAVLDEFDPTDDPALDCISESLPSTILPVFPVQFSRVGEDELHIWYEEFDGQRVVHLGMTEHPDDSEPSYMGHSIGRFENGVLVIDTRHFEETVWGLGRGAPSGTQKHLIERYRLADGGMRLEVEYRFEDPEYMTEAVTMTGEMFLKLGYEFEAWDCDAEAARRHLPVE